MRARLDSRTVLARAPSADLEREELSMVGGLIVSFVDGVSDLGIVSTRAGIALEVAAREAEALLARSLLEVCSEPVEIDPAELDEPVDLDVVRRRLVLETYHALDRVSYYELLEVHPDADRKVIQRAYFRLSKIFHPDTLYGKNLGSYRAKMEAVFQRMTRAYDVLGRSKRRAEYDAKLGAARLERLRARMMMMVATEPPPRLESGEHVTEPHAEVRSFAPTPHATRPAAAKTEESPRPEAPTRPPERPAAPRAATPRATTPATGDVERRRRLAAARLSGAVGSLRPRPVTTPAVSRPSSVEDRRAAARELAQTVQRASASTGTNPRLAAIFAAADQAEAAGRYVEALTHLGEAQHEAPERAAPAISRVRRAMAAANVEHHRARALTNLEAGNLREAAFAFRDVTLGAPTDAAAHAAAADCLRRMDDPDLKAARDHATRAVEIEPSVLAHSVLLAQIYLDAGMKHNAIRALGVAEAIDEGAPEIAQLRAKLGG